MSTLEKKLLPIKMILSDVDGVMTDGGIIYQANGDEIKQFHSHDGLGVRLWQKAGYQFGIISARSSQIVRLRADELEISLVRQGVRDKWEAVEKIMKTHSLTAEEICFIGDDLPDLPVILRIGFGATVADAVEEVRNAADWTSRFPGGQGAIRDLVETILKAQNNWNSVIQSYTLFM